MKVKNFIRAFLRWVFWLIVLGEFIVVFTTSEDLSVILNKIANDDTGTVLLMLALGIFAGFLLGYMLFAFYVVIIYRKVLWGIKGSFILGDVSESASDDELWIGRERLREIKKNDFSKIFNVSRFFGVDGGALYLKTTLDKSNYAVKMYRKNSNDIEKNRCQAECEVRAYLCDEEKSEKVFWKKIDDDMQKCTCGNFVSVAKKSLLNYFCGK